MGLNFKQFHKAVLVPTLARLNEVSSVIRYTAEAGVLVAETIWHESDGLCCLYQHPDGPAHGICMYEKPTWDWIYGKYKATIQVALTGSVEAEFSFEDLDSNLALCVAMCRLRYQVVREPLPKLEGLQARAAYWGKYYQTQSDPDKIALYCSHANDIPWRENLTV